MKKFLATVLAVMMIMTVMAVPAFAAEPGAHTVVVFDSDGNEITSDSVIYTMGTITVKVTAVGEESDLGEMGTLFGVKLSGTVSDFEVVSCKVDSVETNYEPEDYYGTAIYDVSGPLLATGAESTLEMVFAVKTDADVTVGAYVSGETTMKTAFFSDGFSSLIVNVEGPSEVDPGTGGETEEPETPTETPTGTLTGETIDDVTLSQWADGSVLELDKGYTIPVIGNLDENDNDVPDKEEQPLTPEDSTITVYVYWTDMEFNYSKEWDDDTLAYSWNWKNGEDYIKVENRSSVDVTADLSFTGETGYENAVAFSNTDADGNATEMIGATWDGSTLSLDSGNQGTEEDVVAPTGTILVNVADDTTMTTTDDNENADLWTTLGQITITVSAVTE